MEKGTEEKVRAEEEGRSEIGERVRKMERECERRERYDKRKNVIVKGYKEERKDVKDRIGEIFKHLGARVKIEEVRTVKTGRGDLGGMAVVKLMSEEDRKEVMVKKKALKGGGSG